VNIRIVIGGLFLFFFVWELPPPVQLLGVAISRVVIWWWVGLDRIRVFGAELLQADTSRHEKIPAHSRQLIVMPIKKDSYSAFRHMNNLISSNINHSEYPMISTLTWIMIEIE
jgi:hypothetical protein